MNDCGECDLMNAEEVADAVIKVIFGKDTGKMMREKRIKEGIPKIQDVWDDIPKKNDN